MNQDASMALLLERAVIGRKVERLHFVGQEITLVMDNGATVLFSPEGFEAWALAV